MCCVKVEDTVFRITPITIYNCGVVMLEVGDFIPEKKLDLIVLSAL